MKKKVFLFFVIVSLKERSTVFYDEEALGARKKPENSALNMAQVIGMGLLNEEQYRALQQMEFFDAKQLG